MAFREDDTNWPKKNIVGKQELEIRIGNDHIAFEVRLSLVSSALPVWFLTQARASADGEDRFPGRYPGQRGPGGLTGVLLPCARLEGALMLYSTSGTP